MNYVIAIDIGTQGTKACLFNELLQSCNSCFIPSRLISPAPGIVWQNTDDIFFSVTKSISTLLQTSSVSNQDIAAISIDSQMAGIIGIDQAGNAVTYYDSWLDTRCKSYVQLMQEKAGLEILTTTGCPVTYTHGPKILWWKYEKPDIYKQIHKFVVPHAYVACRLAGLDSSHAYIDLTCLHYSGFADNLNKIWSQTLLNDFDIPISKMPQIISPFDIIGYVTKETSLATGLSLNTPIVAGAGDTAASIMGAGIFEPGQLLDCAGTASVLCGAVDKYCPDTVHQTLTMMRSPLDGLWYPLAYINGGGLCLRWLRDELTGTPPVSYEKLEAEASKLPPGSEHLIFIPHFSGKILPSNPNMRGCFAGLNVNHKRGHMYRAIMEGISYEYHSYFETLKTLFPLFNFSELYSIGGGSKSPLFLQLKSDILNLPCTSFSNCDTALVGSAAIAGTAVQLFADCKRIIKKSLLEDKTVYPNALVSEQYHVHCNAYKSIMNALEPIYNQQPFS